MKILRRIEAPTGDILIGKGSRGPIEFLSLGDYGKDVNLKCDAMGLSRDLGQVIHQEMLPLSKKWVVTISTQYGCLMGCEFCDVPKVNWGGNATLNDLQQQIITALSLHPEVEHTDRLNIHFARMGEPTFNPAVLDCAKWLKAHVDPEHNVHPVVSTMMPKENEWLKTFIHTWMRIKNRVFRGEAGLQISINSTDREARDHCFRGKACSLSEISRIMEDIVPLGRKITLNFAVATVYPVDAEELRYHFDPERFICKLTPMHKTAACFYRGIYTDGDYTTIEPYRDIEEDLKASGFDVLVFVASKEEDESRITCGNAILSMPNTSLERRTATTL